MQRWLAKQPRSIAKLAPPVLLAGVVLAAVIALASPARADVYATRFGFSPDNPEEKKERGHQTAELQAAIDYCKKSGDHKLILDAPPGYEAKERVYTVSRVTYFPGLEIDGQGATLKKRQPSFKFDVIFESYPRDDRDRKVPQVIAGRGRLRNSRGESVMVQDIDRRSYVWDGEGESPLTIFRNLTIVGDLESFEVKEFNQYQREHAHGIVVAASDKNRSRLNVLIDHCRFVGHTGNGIYARDAKVVVRDSSGFDCFRGVVSVTRNTDILIERLTSTGRWGGIDIEPENGPAGKVVVHHLSATHDLDVALLPDWTAELRDIDVEDGPINFVLRDRSELLLEDARIKSGDSKIEIRTLGRDGRITFRRVNLYDSDILWIQRNGRSNVFRLEKAKHVGRIQQAQQPRDGDNRLIRED